MVKEAEVLGLIKWMVRCWELSDTKPNWTTTSLSSPSLARKQLARETSSAPFSGEESLLEQASVKPLVRDIKGGRYYPHLLKTKKN